MKKLMKDFIFIAIAMICTSTSVNAALVSRLDGQAYYDTVTDMTWLANANAANTAMDWDTALNWVSNLEVGGVTGWTLATTVQPDANCSNHSGSTYYGYGCSSALATMFQDVLGGTEGTSIATSHNANYDLFTGIQENAPYWSSTELDGNPYVAWAQFFEDGTQGLHFESNLGYAWAVFQGDVASVAPVPVPAAVWCFISGLMGMMLVVRRKNITP